MMLVGTEQFAPSLCYTFAVLIVSYVIFLVYLGMICPPVSLWMPVIHFESWWFKAVFNILVRNYGFMTAIKLLEAVGGHY